MKHKYGRNSQITQDAYTKFKKSCKEAKTAFQYTLPDILKYRPKQFWHMIKPIQ